MENTCGACTLCCDLLPIKELNKKPNVMCALCDKGCTIHGYHPESCKNFDCLYITHNLEEELLPETTGVIFEQLTTKIYLATYRVEAPWKDQDIKRYINKLNREGISVIFSAFDERRPRVFTAKEHEAEKVLKLALMIAHQTA